MLVPLQGSPDKPCNLTPPTAPCTMLLSQPSHSPTPHWPHWPHPNIDPHLPPQFLTWPHNFIPAVLLHSCLAHGHTALHTFGVSTEQPQADNSWNMQQPGHGAAALARTGGERNYGGTGEPESPGRQFTAGL